MGCLLPVMDPGCACHMKGKGDSCPEISVSKQKTSGNYDTATLRHVSDHVSFW